MPAHHFVIDGSNLATEGRTLPSFEQLRGAIDAFRAEHEDANVTVVVDASFEHRIDDSERAAFVAAEAAGELVSPPAGAVGRGDGFLLQIANRTGGTVVSNDSFQEFHGDYDWLFEPGRLIGGKPVPGVGWIFSLRSPVRGARSHKALRDAEKDKKADRDAKGVVRAAIVAATKDALEPGEETETDSAPKRRRKGPPPGAVNDPHPFLLFVVNHRLGASVEGEVEEFASHGAFVRAEGLRCYVPLTAMGEPPPNSAREVLRKGETRAFVVQAFDPPRRGVELAMPGFEQISGVPTPETLEAEMEPASSARRSRGRRRGRSTSSTPAPETVVAATPVVPIGPPASSPPKRTRRRTVPAAAPAVATTPAPAATSPAKPPATKKAPGRTTAPKKAATKAVTTKQAAPGRTPAKKAAAPKAAPQKSAPQKAAPKKSAPQKAAAKKASPVKAPAKKGPAKKVAAIKPPATRQPTKAVPAKKTPAKQAPAAKKAPAKTPATKKAAPGRAPAAKKSSAAPGGRTRRQ